MLEKVSDYGSRRPRRSLVGRFGSDHHACSHAVQFYLQDDFLCAIVCDFIHSALKAGDGAVIVATESRQNALQRNLERRGLDVPDLRRKNLYIDLDVDRTLAAITIDGEINFAKFEEISMNAISRAQKASTAKEPRVLVFGELVALLWKKRQIEKVLAVERFWDELAGRHRLSLLCGYPINEFMESGTEQSYRRICSAHQIVSSTDSFPTPESETRLLSAIAGI